ncbi:MAG: NUDIX hydrolase [Dysgonomonas sp.]
MKEGNSQISALDQTTNTFIPNISVDCIILSFHLGDIKVLLCKPNDSDKWMLPGGFVGKDEDPDESAYRVLAEKTGLKREVYLRQFYFFGKKGRIGDKDNDTMMKRLNIDWNKQNGQPHPNRFISLAYYSLIKYSDVNISVEKDEDISWFDINNTPDLYADHEEIVYTAITTIRKQIGFIPMGYELLPEKFTMPELRGIYEAILGRELDRRNFQRKMLTIGYIKPLNETRKIGAHKSPNLYTFVKDKYAEAEENGIQIMSNNL